MKRITASVVSGLLLQRYSSDKGWSCFPELRNSTGFAKTVRTADFVAVNTWPSRYEVVGHEIKVSRSDWLSELRNPAKADEFFKRCHRWYLVTADGVAQAEEIPPSWGWLSVVDGKLKSRQPAKVTEAQRIDPFALSLVRASSSQALKSAMSDLATNERMRIDPPTHIELEHARKAGEDAARRELGFQIADLQKVATATERMTTVMRDIGLLPNPTGYYADQVLDEIRDVVKLCRSLQVRNPRAALCSAKDKVEALLQLMDWIGGRESVL